MAKHPDSYFKQPPETFSPATSQPPKLKQNFLSNKTMDKTSATQHLKESAEGFATRQTFNAYEQRPNTTQH
jgi:hypothetical protein